VLYEPVSPAALTHAPDGARTVLGYVKTAAEAIHLPIKETNTLVLRRGPYVVAAGLDAEPSDASQPAAPVTVRGDLIDLFDADLKQSNEVAVAPGTRALLLDVNFFKSSTPRILAAAAKITAQYATVHSLSFTAEGIDQTQAVVRVLAPRAPRSVTLDGKALDPADAQYSGRTLLLRFANTAAPQQVEILF
jgi:hypothetical protein